MSERQRFIVAGTAGHIDHGKTELVRALTGVDTDRLKEERERGISIDLGFAELRLDDDTRVGLVDVPGHERFVRNMLAGVGGIDLVALVIAADEGVMPQTREHLDIIDLLGVEAGIVALTKRDLVDDPEWLELVRLDVEELLIGTALEGAPVVPVSSITGEGMDDLLSRLAERVARVPAREGTGDFRMPVDRVFSVRGFGTVVTGTVWTGGVAVGEKVAVEPGGKLARIRNVQVHGNDAKRARAGQRTALALVGVERAEVPRGTTVATPGLLSPAYMADARIRVLSGEEKALLHRQRVHFHHGTAECLARVVPLEGESIAPGATGLAQLRLEAPLPLLPGDRFVLRRYSPVTTIAGGIVLDPWARKHRRRRPDVLRGLGIREGGTEEELAAEVVRQAGVAGIDANDPRLSAALPNDQGEALVSAQREGFVTMLPGGKIVATEHVDRALAFVENLASTYHEKNPLQAGISGREAASRLEKADAGIPGDDLVELAVARGIVRRERDRIALPGFRVELSEADLALRDSWLKRLGGESRFSPPSPKEVIESAGTAEAARAVFHAMIEGGELVQLTRDLALTKEALAEIEDWVVEKLSEGGSLAVGDLREHFGCTRKYLIPLLEHLDRKGITRREGDRRVAGGALDR
ncbi:MAG: selenocysteine-specific translation elongation factor [Gemmatimonadetes bacterium]|nr:selenocysteine-specific translation elongation factor [Gemmatimonadota bacterium]